MAIVLQIVLDEQGNIQTVERLNKALRETGKAAKESTPEMNALDKAIDNAAKKYISFAFAYNETKKLARLAKDLAVEFTNTAMSFEQMKITLDQLTRGQGQKWFSDLNLWALKMPLNTEAAVNGFIRLKAMGLQPTIEQMEILLDATTALGGRSDTFDGIVLAMGQIYAKQQLMSQELRQLAERGIPVYEILSEKLQVNAKDLEMTNHQAISANVALKALFEGMAERYGGLSKTMMYETGMGIKEQLIGNWKEYQRVMMDGKPYEFVKNRMQDIANIAEHMTTNLKLQQAYSPIGQEAARNLYGGAGINFASSEIYAKLMGYELVTKEEYNRRMAAIYEEIRRISSGVNVNLAGYQAPATREAGNELKLNLPVAETTAQAEVETTKRSLKYLESEYKKYAEMDKKNFGVITQTKDQATRTASMYLQRTIEEEKDNKLEIDMQYWNELQQLQKDGRMMQISLQYEGMERDKELLRLEYETKIAQYEEGDARIVELRKNMAMEMDMIDEQGLRDAQNRVVQFASTWGSMWAQAAQQSGNAIDNIIDDLRRLAARMAVQATIGAVFNAATGGAGGFGGGFSAVIKSMLGMKGMAEGGYAGNQMGFYHPQEYISNKNTVDYYGVGFFDMLAKTAKLGGSTNNSMVVNNNFSAADKAAMLYESDEVLSRRITRLIDERKIKV